MNKTYPININGLVFYINDDAFIVLDNYLNELKQYYANIESGDEIVSDIESRISELFSEKLINSKQIINLEDVNEIIIKLGRVQDFEDEEYTQEKDHNSNRFNNKKSSSNKKFYRDKEDGMLAGVAMGLSHYFGIDALLIRILFIVLIISGTIGFWIYIILWFVFPEAKSPSEKLEMRGEPVNLTNIEKTIREEFEELKTSIKHKSFPKKIQNFILQIISLLSKLIVRVLLFMKNIFGFIFLIFGVILLSILASFFLFDLSYISVYNNEWLSFPIHDILYLVANEKQSDILILSFSGILLIPIIFITYTGLSLLLDIKKKSPIFRIISFILFLFSVIIFSLAIADVSKEFNKEGEKSYTINSTVTNSLYLDIKDNSLLNIDGNYLFASDEIILTKDSVFYKCMVKIHESEDSLFHINVEKIAHGRNKRIAFKNAEEIDFDLKINNDTVFFNLYSKYPRLYRGQRVLIDIYKPKHLELQYSPELFKDDIY